MGHYLVRAHYCKSGNWVLEIPALGQWTVVWEKSSIVPIAQLMIFEVDGADVEPSELDLALGRVLGSVEEYATKDLEQRRRWSPGTGSASTRRVAAPQDGPVDSRTWREQVADLTAAAKGAGYDLRPQKTPPYGWELVNTITGEGISGSLRDIERYLLGQ